MSTDLTDTVRTYVHFWNADGADQRRIGTDLFTDDVAYHAVVGVLAGVDALVGFRTQVVEHLGDAQFRARGTADHHHGRARLPWEIVLGDGTSFAAGTDILEVADDGRVRAVSTFLDRPPAGFDHHEHADTVG